MLILGGERIVCSLVQLIGCIPRFLHFFLMYFMLFSYCEQDQSVTTFIFEHHQRYTAKLRYNVL